MKACFSTGEKRRIECREVPVPSIVPGALLLKTRYACVCGSDLEYLDDSLSNIHEVASLQPGIVPGHEFVAEIVEVGEGVNGWSVGDRVVPGSGLPGIPQPQIQLTSPPGGYETYRAFAEYILTSPMAVQKVPDHVSDEEAVFVEPLSTGVGSVLGSKLGPGKSGVIIGAGKIGLLAMMSAKVSGASPVIVADLVQSRLDKALELGADAVINAAGKDVVEEVMRLTGTGASAVIICVRDGKVLNQAAVMGARGANIVLAGFVLPMEVNPMLWAVKQLKIVGVLGGPAFHPQKVIDVSMHMIDQKQIDPRPLISEIISFDDCQRAIDSVYSGENIAVLLKP